MRSTFLLMFLLLSSFCCAQYPLGMHELGIYMAPENASFSIENFSFGNDSAYAIVSGGEPYAILMKDFPFVTPKALTDNKTIEQALFAYQLSLGFDPNSTSNFFLVHNGLNAVEDDKDPGEAECRRLAGTDHFKCNSLESCKLACFSTPFCPNFAYGGGPGEFISVIWAYENDSLALDAAYDAEEAAYAQFRLNSSKESTDGYLAALSGLNKAATHVASTPLHYYSFCFMPDYALPEITSLQLQAQIYYYNASHFLNLSSLAGKVQNRTLEGLARKKKSELSKLPAIASKTNNSTRQNSSIIALNNSTRSNSSNTALNKSENTAAGGKRFEPASLVPIALALLALMVGAVAAYFVLRKKQR